MRRRTESREKEFLETEFLRNTEGTHWIMASGPKPRSSFIIHALEREQLKNEHLSESKRNKKLTVNLPSKEESKEKPSWVKEPKLTFDANKLLDEEKNPLAEVNKELKKLSSGEIVAITSDFKPEPLIDEFKKKGYEVYCEEESSEKFVTYIKG